MIEVEAPDGSIVEFPDGTDRGTMAAAMQKRFAGPSLSSVGADANRTLAQQPEVMDANAGADIAALSAAANPPVPSTMDRIKSAIMGGGTTLANVADQAAYVPAGIRRGLSKIVGLPVDLVNAGLSWTGLPVSQKPVGGSAQLDDLLRLNGAIPDVRPPSTATERMLTRGAEEIGAAALPVGAAIHAGRMGVQAARELPVLARMFVEPAAINPAGFAGKEMATAAAAGGGAAVASEAARAGGAKEHGAWANTADILGAVGGAAGLGAARMVGGPAKDIAQAIFQPDKFSNKNVTEAVVDRIANNADTLPKVEGKPVDTQPLVDAITRGSQVDAVIPGFKDGVADRTGDAGLANLEYGRQSGPSAMRFTARRTENAAAVDRAINRNAPDGNPADLRAELGLERDRRLMDASVQSQNAADDFERATQSLHPVLVGEGRGANIRAALEGASEQARDMLAAAWTPINRSSAHVDMAPLASDFAGVRRGLSTAEAERFRPPEVEIPQRLSGERPVDPPRLDAQGEPVTETIVQPIREVTGLRSALTDASREALTAGRTNEARIIDQHVTALDNYLDNAVPPELRVDYEAARAATVDYHDRFTRPQTAIAQTLDRTEGVYRQPDSAVAQKFVQADEGRIDDFRALMREAGNDERVVSSVRDQILADVRDRKLLDRPDQLRDYLTRYSTILSDQRFDGTRQELDNAAGLRAALTRAQEAETGLVRDLGTPDTPGRGTIGRYLQYGDERSQDALKGVLASNKPGAAMDELLSFVNNDPAAVAGARKSFWDLMQSKTRSNGETTRTLDGTQPWMPNKLKNFLDEPGNAAVAERLYRGDPEHLSNVRRIADELQNVDLRSRTRVPNTSGTAQSISQVLTPETLQSRFYAYKRGQTSLGFMLTALGSVVARRAVRGAQGEAIEKLLDRALLDPELAARLLSEGNPANRAALARTAKTYLGNEASTLTEILTAKPPGEEDPIKDAITKK
ncbi:hypothetical protein [Rhodopseudomonas pseudopalustris]|uniref:Uncharacterized protein n=1 Tax=Rhodopseudomonas pseudopalustris TaxID=1513892 RepID=A0A1H8WJE4_9BRAD|nr:hypothetical protein [Rhodopseudomonas pseudopalustris]SEP27547.1 hypothetical protein SAMN05444123_112133 [Rhodopseudomonas pseudopalustris]